MTTTFIRRHVVYKDYLSVKCAAIQVVTLLFGVFFAICLYSVTFEPVCVDLLTLVIIG